MDEFLVREVKIEEFFVFSVHFLKNVNGNSINPRFSATLNMNVRVLLNASMSPSDSATVNEIPLNVVMVSVRVVVSAVVVISPRKFVEVSVRVVVSEIEKEIRRTTVKVPPELNV